MDQAILQSVAMQGSIVTFCDDFLSTCTFGGFHCGRGEPASPRQGDVSWASSTLRPPVKLVQFVSPGASALHTLPFGFNPGGVGDMSLIGRGVVTTPPFIDPFCRSVGARSTAQSGHTDPLTSDGFLSKDILSHLSSLSSLQLHFNLYFPQDALKRIHKKLDRID